jgi:hypothetical protein
VPVGGTVGPPVAGRAPYQWQPEQACAPALRPPACQRVLFRRPRQVLCTAAQRASFKLTCALRTDRETASVARGHAPRALRVGAVMTALHRRGAHSGRRGRATPRRVWARILRCKFKYYDTRDCVLLSTWLQRALLRHGVAVADPLDSESGIGPMQSRGTA